MDGDRDEEIQVPLAAHAIADPGPTPLLESLYRDHADTAFRAALRVTGDRAAAEDALHTVFVRLLRRGEVEGIGRAYLKRAAVNAGLDILRKRGGPEVAGEDAWIEGMADDARDPEDRVGSQERHRALRRAIAGLSPKAAEIVSLFYFEELPQEEIATQLETSRGTVAVTLFRARQRLKEALGQIWEMER